MKNLCLIIVAIMATWFTLHAQNADPDVEAKVAADATVRSFVDSWNRADGSAYGDNYWPDAELVDPSGEIVDGRAAIAQEHVDLWAGIFKGSRIAAKVRRVRRLDPNHVIVDFNTELSGIRELPSGSQNQGSNSVLRTHLKHILEKRNGQWKVLSAQNTFIAEDHSMHPRQFSSVDPTTVPWREVPLPSKENLYTKTLLADSQTGTGVDLLRYPAGVVTPRHTHPHGHGMYILQGKLVTNHGTFGPGMFVWFPEGEVIYHGATADQDAVVLFIRHEPFDIQFTDPPSATKPVPDTH